MTTVPAAAPMTRSMSSASPPPRPPPPTAPATAPKKKKKGKTKKNANKNGESSNDESLGDDDLSDLEGGSSPAPSRPPLTESERDDLLVSLSAAIDRATAEQEKCKDAAAKARREMRDLLSRRDSPDVSSDSGLVTAATAAAMVGADATRTEPAETTPVVDRAAKLRSFRTTAGLPADRPRVRFSDTPVLPQKRSHPDYHDDVASDPEECELVETHPRSSAVRKAAALLKFLTESTLSHVRPRLSLQMPPILALVYTASLARAESIMRDRRSSRPYSDFTFSDYLAILEVAQEHTSSLFGQQKSRAQEATFELVTWARELRLYLDDALDVCGSRAFVDSQFRKFIVTLRAKDSASYNPVETASAIFATLTDQVASKSVKGFLSSLAVTAVPPASAAYHRPQGHSAPGGIGSTAGKNKGTKNYPVIPGPGPPGSFWHFGHNAFVRYVEDPGGRRQSHVCMMCGWAGSPSHDAGNCPSNETDIQSWIERAIPVK